MVPQKFPIHGAAAGLIVLTRGGEADQESHQHFFFSSCGACGGREIYGRLILEEREII